jgi:hypothetical protein
MRYATLDAWDKGTSQPQLDTFARAARLVGYTLDELVYGRGEPAAVELSPAQIETLFGVVGATRATRLAFQKHERRGPLTPAYVTTWLAAYLSADGGKPDARIATIEAVNARGTESLRAAGGRPANVEALVRELRAKPTRERKRAGKRAR